jgi:uncharacterized membrane protein
MSSHLNEWLSLAIRWLHVIAGIVWIGESFYFMWLDASLKRDESMPEGVKGESWSVHGGGFYRVIKFQVAPESMPKGLHWFKWEAYTTWISGVFLLAVVYWLQAEAFMIDSGGPLGAGGAVGVGIGTLVLGWIVYDLLCKSPLGKAPWALGVVLLLYVGAVAHGLTQVLSPRAAFIHVGAMVGTWMAGNVAMVIIPNQKKIVASLLKGEAPDPRFGPIGKLRSTHNNYLTLPVIFVMISSHYPSTYGHPWNWAILLGLFAVGALTRVYFNQRNAGQNMVWVLPVAALIFVSLALVSAPPALPEVEGAVGWADVEPIIETHCAPCHSASPTDDVFKVAPNGVIYDTPEQAAAKAILIKQRAVDTPTMPLGNKTNMTDAERAKLGAWVEAGAPIP